MERLTSEQSLKIITEMIQQAKGSMQSASYYFILWGWVAVIGNIGQYFLITEFGQSKAALIWFIAIPASILTILRSKKHSNNGPVTHMGRIIINTWVGYGVCIAVCIIFMQFLGFQVHFLIMLLSGLATLITATIIKYKPLILGAISFWIFIPFLFLLPREFQPIIMSFSLITGYLIPAYRLKNSKK